MKERKDYCTAEFSTWRSHSVLMSKAGVPPQCRAQQVVNCLRASVQCPKVGQSRNVECSHHITLAYTTYSLILRKTKDKKKLHHKQRIVTYTTPRNVHVGRRRRNSIQIQVFFFSLPAASDPQAPLQKLSLHSARSRMESCFL